VLMRIDRAVDELLSLREEVRRSLSDPEPVLLTVGQFVQRTGISRRTAFARIHDGTIRSVKVGRSRRIPASEVLRLARGGVA
jgi:excisionase family DNA binding protein